MASGGYDDWDDDNRRVVYEGRQVLERTSASLARSNQIAIETENIGTQVISDLGEQRESLLRSQRRLENANDGLSKSNSILRSMQRTVFYNKLILVLIILLEALILGGLIFIKFFKKK
ncbi:hypothetical protein HA402_008662 [Bradysia odoriphaga]|uniref:vesicle transport through interaction with t-SNAREs homolog 1B n=1 Tax=Bradysia coprophila TaxID=38358 RepID=UPI00187D6E82|nr:vesicle transport through interaction with t-SNAREs homolog 1B [Bradysia coprophila]KAG4074253.1 hypothetical protein HA402_008662 [Bradysia odoriphaga]